MTLTSVLFTSVETHGQTAFPEAIGFVVQASADAVKMDVETGLFGDAFPAIPPDEPPVSGSAAHTEAVYDDLGNNHGMASAPYPGRFPVAMPGLIRAVGRPGGQPGIGQAPPLPNWPFIVSSTYPGREESSQVNGPYGVSATSGPHGSVADAKVGAVDEAAVLSPTSHSSATWDPSSGNLVAKADSSFAAFSLDPVLKLAEVESHVTLTATPGADQPTMSSSFEVGTMTVAGVKVGVTDSGFVVGPSSHPQPDLSSLEPVLSAAGIEIEFLPAETTPTSIRSAGLRVSSMQEFPVQGPVKETWTVGRVSADLDPGTAFASFTYPSADASRDTAVGAAAPNGEVDRPEDRSLPQSPAPGAPRRPSVVAAPASSRAPEPPSVASHRALATSATRIISPAGQVPEGEVTSPPTRDPNHGKGTYAALAGGGLAIVIGAAAFSGLGIKLLRPSIRGAAAATAAVVVAASMVVTTPAWADSQTPQESPNCPEGWQQFGEECYPNVAIITPTLGFISFGATFGGPIMCFMATGALQSIGRGVGADAVANEFGRRVTPYCTSGPNQFGDGMAQLAKALGPLTVINPMVNPILDNVANGFRSFADDHGSTIAPFGRAAHEMGAFVEFFKGS